MDEIYSYFYGLVLTDGSVSLQTRNRGKIQIELSIKDRDILDELHTIFPESKISTRCRNTNFSNNYESCTFSLFQKKYRDILFHNGFPKKNKTLFATVPNFNYSKRDFWRGIIDGDGSVGTKKRMNLF